MQHFSLFKEPIQGLGIRATYLPDRQQKDAFSWMLNQPPQSISSDKLSLIACVQDSENYCFPL